MGRENSQLSSKIMQCPHVMGRVDGLLFFLVLALTTLWRCLELLGIYLFTVCLCDSNVTY